MSSSYVEQPQDPKLSVIVPFRNNENLPHLLERLEYNCANFNNKKIEFIVVDSGSRWREVNTCNQICTKYNVRYLWHDTTDEVFSIGGARDFGAQHATGQAITFLDVDCITSDNFWDRLISFSNCMGVFEKKKCFFVVPVFYLSEFGTKKFLEIKKENEEEAFTKLLLDYLYAEKKLVQDFAPCSSIMVVNRIHYLSVGGHRSEFRGHGYEDFELYHRLMIEANQIERATNYYNGYNRWDILKYEGFRAQFSLLGRAAFQNNLFAVHLWHPRDQTSSFYSSKNVDRNREIWKELFQEFEKDRFHPESLTGHEARNKKVLVFGKPKSNAVRCIRDVLPLLGSAIYASEFDFFKDGKFQEDDFVFFLKETNIDEIIFHNPYANNSRISIYNFARKNNIKYLVFERGALPDSWYFDANGFNADSTSYEEVRWNKPLSKLEKNAADNYIRSIIEGNKSLEEQGLRIGADSVANELGIVGRKILFVPLQRPSDTVIKYFSGRVGNFTNFVEEIDQLALELKKYGWSVVCKKHPLESEVPSMHHTVLARDDMHFVDLLEACSGVALINSGVGVHAMMMKKPCYVFGDAFYISEKINYQVKTFNPKILAELISRGYELDSDKVCRFIHYLRNEFYSFGHPKVFTRIEKDGSKRSITESVDFYVINIPNQINRKFDEQGVTKVSETAPLYERFRASLNTRVNTANITRLSRNQLQTLSTYQDLAIRESIVFQIYRKLYSPLLSARERLRIQYTPADFFLKARSPISLIGKYLFKNHIE